MSSVNDNATITYRAAKGQPLTNDEVDANFQSLDDSKLKSTSPSVTTSIVTPSTTFALINDTATTLNIGGASTSTNIGASTGTTTVGNDFHAKGNVVAFASSDRRLKDNIRTIDNALAIVQELRGVRWKWNENASEALQKTPVIGLIAQDTALVVPEVVVTRDDGLMAMNYERLIGVLVEAIKELNNKVEELSRNN